MDAFKPETPIRDVLTSHPEATTVFLRHGLGCPTCLAADMETLSSVASMHDIGLELLLADLNALIATGEA